jgi:hypothetical protein
VPTLGTVNFTIATGSNANCPADSTPGSFLKGRGLPTGGIIGAICNLTRGNFTGSGPIQLVGGAINPGDGRAPVTLGSPVVIGAQLPTQASDDWICVRIEANGSGWVDCNGGSNADVTALVDSNSAAAPPPPLWNNAWVTISSGAGNSGVGAAVVPVSLKSQTLATTCPGPSHASWGPITPSTTWAVTGTATSTITEGRQCPGGGGLAPSCPAPPYTASLAGSNLTCVGWTTQTGRSLVAPLFIFDQDFGANPLGGTFGIGDIAVAGRLSAQ